MSILSPQEKDELFAKLDDIGEEKVRENLAQKIYGTSNKPLVEEWLRKQEENRNQAELGKEEEFRKEEIRIASEATEEARKATLEARTANELSREANEFARSASEAAKEANEVARDANSISLSANDSSKEAIRIARQNKNIAIAAFIISSITAIVAIIISLCKK